MEATMPAAVYQGEHRVTVEQLPVPAPAPDEVLLEISHCGICGSDLHFVVEDWGRPGSVHGHEYSGVVAAVGAEVQGWAVGDRAVGGPAPGCGRCEPCRRGRTNLCLTRPRAGVTPWQGAFAGYKTVAADALFRVPDGLDLRTAALTEPLAVALRGVRRAEALGLGRGAPTLVSGAGPIGLLTIAVLHERGFTDVTVSEPAARRQELAAKVGASRVVEPSTLVTPRLPMDLVEAAVDAAFECSGRAEATQAALGQLGRGGVLVLSGTGMVRPALESNRVILNELVITGTCEYDRDDYEAAIALLAGGRLPTEALIEPDDIGLADIEGAMHRLVAGELAGKVMVVPRA
jgi:(R,R)-butanediol dehydrogenase/meso-butanediol dehydrogenase/diacetyl reductase